jgi:Ca2+-binding EF-hand superfamily protein
MDDTDDINKIFQIVDSDGSGYLNKEKFQHICPHLSPSEIDIIFNDLDIDHDNRISLKEFTHGFKELIKTNDNYRSLNNKKLINHENDIDKEEEDLSTHMTQIQINEVFNHLSWYEKRQLY